MAHHRDEGKSMAMEIEKAAPVSLRSLGLDERWLQDRINTDPSILGLGNLEIAGKEHRQPVGGRIDFLMRDTEDDTYYEVEVMLGALDESHIIRTIEYWDVERQRRPNSNHRAVIVAEQITTRFFNVVRLLNRAVPLIAIKLSAFPMNGRVVLHPVTVLDVIEESADELDVEERTDRAYWETRSPIMLAMLDKVLSLLRSTHIEPRVAYNRHHIALGTTGWNFCWFHPRKPPATHIEFRVAADIRDAVVSELQEVGIDASSWRTEFGKFNITTANLEKHLAVIASVLRRAEEASRS
jgi:hypothetical protein